MSSHRLIHVPGFVRWGIHIDIAPQWPWLALQSLALWPIWVWMSQHLVDRADNALGLLTLAAAAALIWHQRGRLRASPRLGWLAGALTGTVLATIALSLGWPDCAKLCALSALAAGLRAFLPHRTAPPHRRPAPRWRGKGSNSQVEPVIVWIDKAFGNTFVNRVCHKLAFAIVMLALLAWNVTGAL
ncbi:hypothetical protein [Rhodoferax sp.]|uniref:hypothetical protein n=1 Tax=Rhodoferax sp. TaxID=50421 RepID=UPI00275C02CA|nr:hypothetical protein [Rhodoferax sp.]